MSAIYELRLRHLNNNFCSERKCTFAAILELSTRLTDLEQTIAHFMDTRLPGDVSDKLSKCPSCGWLLDEDGNCANWDCKEGCSMQPLCPHCNEPLVCSNRVCTGKALPDVGEEELVEKYTGKLNACFMEGFLRPVTLEKFKQILHDMLREREGR